MPPSDSDEEDADAPVKGTRGLIETQNPNRVPGASKPNAPIQLTRRQKEEIEAEKQARRQEKLVKEGKTAEAKSDLERLADIRRKREEAAKERELERKKQEDATKKGKEGTIKKL